jgi:hypothetical protein
LRFCKENVHEIHLHHSNVLDNPGENEMAQPKLLAEKVSNLEVWPQNLGGFGESREQIWIGFVRLDLAFHSILERDAVFVGLSSG